MSWLYFNKLQKFSFGAWNIQSLVESEGPIAIYVARSGSSVAVDKKALFMVQEFKRFGVRVAGIIDTKWFGQHVYDIDGLKKLLKCWKRFQRSGG